jgi:hypothetical protein
VVQPSSAILTHPPSDPTMACMRLPGPGAAWGLHLCDLAPVAIKNQV